MTSPIFLQILDSRGNPTIRGVWSDGQTTLRCAVPSGASTGVHEALELRDGAYAYGGKSVLLAVQHANALADKLPWGQADVLAADNIMHDLDGTPNKVAYGANAVLAVSLMQALVQAYQHDMEVFQLIASLADKEPALPLPFANVLNGGKHAGTRLTLQEFMIVPWKAESFYEATRQVAETYHVLHELIAERYGAAQTGLGDEGGFAPDIATAREALNLLVDAMHIAGHDMAIAIDAAASEFFHKGIYRFFDGREFTPEELSCYYLGLLRKYPIISLEDPFDQDDFSSFADLRARVIEAGIDCQIVGDDLTVTNTTRIERAAHAGAADCLLLKINQIGSLSEALDAARHAEAAGWNVMVSHRSGETTDSFISDLATGLACGQLKLGAPARGERTAKYNRLLELELRFGLQLRRWPVKK